MMNSNLNLKLIVSLFLFVFVSAGCGGHQARHRLYKGPELPKSEVSIIKGFVPLVLLQIDGIAGPNKRNIGPDTRYQYNSWFDGSFNVELKPGKHNLLIYYKASTAFSRIAYKPENMDVFLEAGKTYTLQAWRDRWQWYARIIDSGNGQQLTRAFKH